MEMLNPELQLQTTEDDVTRGLLAANAAQDMYETVVARYPQVHGSAIGTVTTTVNTEATAYPTGLLRLDGMDYIDPSTSRPAWKLDPLYKRGGHATHGFWPNVLMSTSQMGKPVRYWTNGTNIYWSPLPSGTHTVRWYGFQAASDITASGTFAYPDAVALPLAAVAVRIIKTGLDDDPAAVLKFADDLFDPLVEGMSKFRREQGRGVNYHYRHDT